MLTSNLPKRKKKIRKYISFKEKKQKEGGGGGEQWTMTHLSNSHPHTEILTGV
jgi:hypothetical protein